MGAVDETEIIGDTGMNQEIILKHRGVLFQ